MINSKAIMHELITRVIGFLIFLILLGIVNLLTNYIRNPIFSSVVSFLNSNIWLIVIFSVIFLIGEIFGYLSFPLNIPYPLFNAVGGVFLIQFAFKLLKFILNQANIQISLGVSLSTIENIVIIVVFIIVLIVGYAHVIMDATRPRRKRLFRDE